MNETTWTCTNCGKLVHMIDGVTLDTCVVAGNKSFCSPSCYQSYTRRQSAKQAWTTEFPSKPGWYWVRNCRIQGDNPFPLKGPETVHIVAGPGDSGNQRYVNFIGYGIRRDAAVVGDRIISAEWYGPIEPPE